MANILVVDDDQSIRIEIQSILYDQGHAARLAEDMDAAQEELKQNDIDVVIAGVIPPWSKPLDAVKSIRALAPCAQIILMANDPEDLSISDALSDGAFDCLTRPLCEDAVIKTVDHAVKIKTLEDQNRNYRKKLDRLAAVKTRKMEESEATVRVLLDSSTDAAALMDTSGTILMLNTLMAERANSLPDALVGASFFDTLFLESKNIAKKMVAQVLESKKPIFFQDKREGQIFKNRLYPVFDSKARVTRIAFFSSDITTQRRMEQDRIRLETAIEQSPESIVITNKKAEIQYVNPAFEKITGYSRREIIGKNPRILQSGKQDKAFYAELWRTLTQGDVWRGRLINKKKNGAIFDEDASITPVKNKDGKVSHYVAVKRDVTEEVKLKAQLQRAQEMEAIGVLAGGIAHDFNNILYPIIGYAEICVEDLKADSKNREYVQEILTAAKRAQDLVKQILLFSRQTSEERKPVQIKLILKEILKLIRASLPSTIEIRQNIDSDSLIVADPVEIHQILMNLFTNAYHAMREQGGILDISLSDASLTQQDVSLNKRLKPGPYIKLKVRDTGPGMSRLLIERIFEPYFTNKEKDDGAGLALSMVHGIVTNLKGDITVSSEIGEGTTFTVFIPRIDAFIPETQITAVADLPTGSEQILVVDDERVICKMARNVLQRLGYRVTTFTDSLAALEAFEQAPDHFDLLITDMTMPRMTGVELAQKVLRTRPEFPILLITGYSHLVNKETASSCGFRKVVMKPIIKKDLAQAVHDALGKSS